MKKKKVNIVINIFVILVVLSIVLYFSLKDDYENIINSIFNMDVRFFILAVILFCFYRILVGFSNYNLVRANGEKISIFKAIQISFIILFFNGVTPFAGGGQPMQIYYLHNEKIGVTKATNITLQNFIVYQISLILVGIFALLDNYFFGLFPNNSLIKRLVILGFVINLLVLVVTYILSFGKKTNRFICNRGISLLARLKFIKNPKDVRNKLNTYLNKFHSNAVLLKKKKGIVILNIFVNILGIVVLYIVPYAVFKGLNVNDVNVLESVVSTAYVMTIGSFVPIPGGTGGIEYGFIFFYGHLVKGSILNAAMLVWRFITYYLGIIFGALALACYRKKERK